jgi:hypothetical protein
MIIISDTSPLVCLLHLNKIDLLKDLFGQVIIPAAVASELINANTINQQFFQSYPFFQIRTALNAEEVLQLRNVLDAGESEAIVLSKELNADLLLIDEDRGRKFAIKYGLRIKGVLGVLLQAKEKGLISRIRPLIERLQTEIILE